MSLKRKQLQQQQDKFGGEEPASVQPASGNSKARRVNKQLDTDSDNSSDEEDDKGTTITTKKGKYTNKQRVLIVSSRGVTARHRHLLEDLKKLMPHHRSDNKLDAKHEVQIINEIAEIKHCNQLLYLEARKHQDLYLTVGRTPQGPTVKFHVVNVHTMDELKLTGNCMLGSRPLLNFDTAFERSPHAKVMKNVLIEAFTTPLGHPKSKPFIDHIMSFFLIKGKIWIRNYQIVAKNERSSSSSSSSSSTTGSEHGKSEDTNLVEIGPRLVLIPMRIFNGSLGGPTLYQNQAFVNPNIQRQELRRHKGERYVSRALQTADREVRVLENQPPIDELSNNRIFKLSHKDDDNDD